jgi:hypothetical protein
MMTVLTTLLKNRRDVFVERHLPRGIGLLGDLSGLGSHYDSYSKDRRDPE